MNSIKNIFLKYRQKLIVGFSIALIAVVVVNIYFVLEVKVTSNDECYWIPKKVSADSVAIYFDIVKVEGVTWEAGIRNGDQLIAISWSPFLMPASQVTPSTLTISKNMAILSLLTFFSGQ